MGRIADGLQLSTTKGETGKDRRNPQEAFPFANNTPSTEDERTFGNKNNYWRWSKGLGFDLTHPNIKEPMQRITLNTANNPITIDPGKSALVIIDMQNIALSEAINKPYAGHDAERALLKHGIPAARRAGIQIVWLTWGFSEKDLNNINPTTARIFSFQLDGSFIPGHGIGENIGPVQCPDGTYVQGGRLLMKDQWNTQLHTPLRIEFEKGCKADPPDVWLHKDRISGMSSKESECEKFLKRQGIRTLLFAGVQTEMCVLATLQDANLKGYDTVLLSDGCGTCNGEAAVRSAERSCTRAWGFMSTCEALDHGVSSMN